ncbi:MAG: heavy-metal-associated domain-containing protein [Saprospiraceae bacterium]
MKILIFICIAALSAHYAYAQQPATGTAPVKKVATAAKNTQTAQFQVWGNCGMCKRTIETAAKGMSGIQSANWNMDTHQFTVVFDPAQTGVDKVHLAIAAAGYDTDVVKGNDEAYSNLPGCCQYDRRQ